MAPSFAVRSQNDRMFHGVQDDDGILTRTVFTEPHERLLRDGSADGPLRSADPMQGATVLFDLVGWTYVELRTGPGCNPERAAPATPP